MGLIWIILLVLLGIGVGVAACFLWLAWHFRNFMG